MERLGGSGGNAPNVSRDTDLNVNNEINDNNVLSKLIDAKVHENESELRKCEEFLCQDSELPNEKKLEIANYCDLGRLKEHCENKICYENFFETRMEIARRAQRQEERLQERRAPRPPGPHMHFDDENDQLLRRMHLIGEQAANFWSNPRPPAVPLSLIGLADQLPSTSEQSSPSSRDIQDLLFPRRRSVRHPFLTPSLSARSNSSPSTSSSQPTSSEQSPSEDELALQQALLDDAVFRRPFPPSR